MKLTMKKLQDEIEALKKRIAELEARPPVVIHNHPPVAQPVVVPYQPVQWPTYPAWRPGEITCATASIDASSTLSWNGAAA